KTDVSCVEQDQLRIVKPLVWRDFEKGLEILLVQYKSGCQRHIAKLHRVCRLRLAELRNLRYVAQQLIAFDQRQVGSIPEPGDRDQRVLCQRGRASAIVALNN